MKDKEIKKETKSKVEKMVEPTVKAKKELTAKAEPKKVELKKAEVKKVEPKKTETKKVEPKKAEVKKVEPVKAETKKVEPKKVEPKKVAAAVEKTVVEVAPAKVKKAGKVEEPKKKRISKGLATHNRRVKQEKRHPGMPKKKVK